MAAGQWLRRMELRGRSPERKKNQTLSASKLWVSWSISVLSIETPQVRVPDQSDLWSDRHNPIDVTYNQTSERSKSYLYQRWVRFGTSTWAWITIVNLRWLISTIWFEFLPLLDPLPQIRFGKSGKRLRINAIHLHSWRFLAVWVPISLYSWV